MSSGATPVFNPTKTATSGAQAPPLAGGGAIAGAGTFYSSATLMENNSILADSIFLTGSLAGTLTLECDNADPGSDLVGGSRWQTYSLLNGGGFTNGVATVTAGAISGGTNPGGYEFQRPTAFRRFRLKFVVSGGSGTIEVLRQVKGGWA